MLLSGTIHAKRDIQLARRIRGLETVKDIVKT
jgi:hypothetical protein